MDESSLKSLLDGVRSGATGVDEALEKLRDLPFEDLGFARLDNHRSLRTGVAEVLFAPGKTLQQLKSLVEHSVESNAAVLVTRIEGEPARELLGDYPFLRHDPQARILSYRASPLATREGYVAVVTAGTADLSVAREAALTLEFLGDRVEQLSDVGVAGLHRLLPGLKLLRGARAVIVVAGMEGALASVVGGLIDRPVIAVPTSVGYGASFGGLSALLGMLNSCSAGVAVVNIDNGFGAACFAHLV